MDSMGISGSETINGVQQIYIRRSRLPSCRGGTKILAFDQFLVKLCIVSSVITLEV
ncbi:hypothetical protein T01_16207 [Trichinella spiralis]|uniref:Uncharacterized protein n=1 Tax=Trichinella spiralis TaxID=6334 RepID=A0A0V1BH06_TRISP|nr:hypothetical protein T01_16207 [Trichinella spiralis]